MLLKFDIRSEAVTHVMAFFMVYPLTNLPKPSVLLWIFFLF